MVCSQNLAHRCQSVGFCMTLKVVEVRFEMTLKVVEVRFEVGFKGPALKKVLVFI